MALSGQAQTTLRVAMTAGDIPDVTGQPDQGFEGYRFVGYTLYDSLILWDLSKSNVEATLKPGLATKWYPDPANNKKWIFELRKDVKFHDGCPFNADNVVWNIERLTNDKAPQFNAKQYAAMRTRTVNIDKAEKVNDSTVAIFTKDTDSLFYIQMSFWMMVSKCQFEKAGSNEKYATMPSGTGPYKFDKVVPRERLELVKNTDYWDKARIPKHDRLVLIPMPEATTPAIDTKKATELLKAANCYPCNVTFAISTSGSGQMQPLPMNELVKAQLEAVGFKVKLEVMDWQALLAISFAGREKHKNIHAVNISRATQDPFSGIFRFAMKKQWAPAGGNWGHYENPEVEKLITQIYTTFDQAARDKLITRVHELMVQDAAMIFVTHDLNPRALSPKLKGFVQAQSWFQDVTPITVTK
jgi:ABC-type transport system substrate-binding protein